MDQKSIELGRRAVACEGWRWVAGMRVFNPEMPRIWYPRVGDDRKPRHGFLLPDLSDPATLGCLLALVREVWGLPGLVAWRRADTGLWFVDEDEQGPCCVGQSEAEVLVSALTGPNSGVAP